MNKDKLLNALNKALHIHERLPRWIDISLVIALIVAVCYFNFDWAQSNDRPPYSDAATHAFHSLQFHQTIAEIRLDRAIFQFLAFRNHYPLLSYQIGEFGYICLGFSKLAPIVGMFPFIALMGFSMYFLGSRLGGRLGGLTAAVISCTSPIVLQYSRVPFIDFQLSAVVAFGLYALCACDYFKDTKYSLMCGLAIAMGMMTKWIFPLFIAFPFLAAVVAALWKTPKSGYKSGLKLLVLAIPLAIGQFAIFRYSIHYTPSTGPGWVHLSLWAVLLSALYFIGKKWRNSVEYTPFDNMSLASLIVLVITGPWYNYNADKILHKVVYQANVIVNVKEVLWHSFIAQNTWVYCAVILISLGLIVGLWRRSTRWFIIQLVLTWCLTMGVLAYAPFDQRYIMPLLVHTTCVSVCSFALLQSLGLIPLVAFTVIGALQISFHTLTSPPHWYTMDKMRESRVPVILPLPCYPDLPECGSYPYDEVISDLSVTYEDKDDGIQWVCLFVGASASEVTIVPPRSFLYYGILNGRKMCVISPLTQEEYMHDLSTQRLKASNFALIYQDPSSNLFVPERLYEPDRPTTREEIITAMQGVSPFFPRKFKTKKTYHFGQDTIVELLERQD